MATTASTMHPGEVRVYADPEAVAHAAAELFVDAAEKSIRERGRFSVALSGGSTPKRTFELLATQELARRVDWNRVEIFWGDERYVGRDDSASNYRMTAEALLRHVPMPAANVHPVPTEITPPESAAAAYEVEIRKALDEKDSIPRFDLVYLGLGTNGHTASLFPHSPALKEDSRLVLADFVQEVNMWRITMTAPLLNRGRTVAFLIAGQDKAQVLNEVMVGGRDPERLPAQLISPEGKLLWLVDKPAAALLNLGSQRKTG